MPRATAAPHAALTTTLARNGHAARKQAAVHASRYTRSCWWPSVSDEHSTMHPPAHTQSLLPSTAGQPLMSEETISHVQSMVAQQGGDAWWQLSIEELLPDSCRHLVPQLIKVGAWLLPLAASC